MVLKTLINILHIIMLVIFEDMSLAPLTALGRLIDLRIQFPHEFLRFLEGESMSLVFLSLCLSVYSGYFIEIESLHM